MKMAKKKIVNAYEQFQSATLKVFDERELQIIKKAKIFGIEMFENDAFAKELFELEFENNIDKSYIDMLLNIYEATDKAIDAVQESWSSS